MFIGQKCLESRALYEKANNLLEKLSKIIHFIVVGTSGVLLVVPKAIISYLKYFTTNLGSEAFELSLLIWLVFWVKYKISFKNKERRSVKIGDGI